jgi:hypothetical protein
MLRGKKRGPSGAPIRPRARFFGGDFVFGPFVKCQSFSYCLPYLVEGCSSARAMGLVFLFNTAAPCLSDS